MLRTIRVLMIVLVALVATACTSSGQQRPGSGQFGGPGQGGAAGGRPGDGQFGGEFAGGLVNNPPTPVAPEIGALELVEVPESAVRSVDPIPEIDLASFLVAQAYGGAAAAQGETAAPPQLDVPDESSPDADPAAPYVSPLLVPPTPVAPPPPAVVDSGAVNIPNGRNTATCVIPNVGACQPTMNAGTDVHLTWTFAVDSPQRFEWWEAQIAVTRNGETYLVHSARNGLDPAVRDPDSTDRWTLAVGQSAQFRAGLGDLELGLYSAELYMCLGSEPCTAGGTWTNVGGDSVHFLVVQPAG